MQRHGAAKELLQLVFPNTTFVVGFDAEPPSQCHASSQTLTKMQHREIVVDPGVINPQVEARRASVFPFAGRASANLLRYLVYKHCDLSLPPRDGLLRVRLLSRDNRPGSDTSTTNR